MRSDIKILTAEFLLLFSTSGGNRKTIVNEMANYDNTTDVKRYLNS